MRSLYKRRLMSIFRQQVGTLFCIHMFWTLYLYLYLHVHFPYRDNLSRICLCLIAQKNIFIPMCGLCICISVFICIYMSTCPYIDNFPRICLCLLAQKNISHSHVVDFGGGAHSVFSWQPQFWQFNDFLFPDFSSMHKHYTNTNICIIICIFISYPGAKKCASQAEKEICICIFMCICIFKKTHVHRKRRKAKSGGKQIWPLSTHVIDAQIQI